jgi:hypothetical protein
MRTAASKGPKHKNAHTSPTQPSRQNRFQAKKTNAVAVTASLGLSCCVPTQRLQLQVNVKPRVAVLGGAHTFQGCVQLREDIAHLHN